MLKRILGFLMTLVLLLAAIPASAELIDVYGTKYEDAVSLLCDIGVMESVSPDRFETNAEVRRSDAATYIAALSGASEVGASALYTDVPETHPAFGAVYVVSQLGIVSGVGDGLFYPEGFISGEQAAKMLVTLAGYGPHAEAIGGYPGGYLAKANELDILKGVSLSAPLTKGELALMIYNTLSVHPAVKESYGKNDGTYITAEETVLSQNLHIYSTRGLITANTVTAVRGPAVRKNEVAIEGEAYLAKGDITEKIGRSVVAYYKKNEAGIKEIVSYTDLTDKDILLDSEEIMPETSASRIVYQRKTEEKKTVVALTGETVVLYNGKVTAPVTEKDLKPAQGSVYVSLDKSGAAAVVSVEEYVDFVVDDVNSDEGVLYLKDNAFKKSYISFSDFKTTVHAYDTEGNPFDLKNCTSKMVVSALESRDGKLCTLYVSENKAEGKVTEKTENEVYIDGKPFEISANYEDTIPTLGENVSLSVNYKHKVVKNAVNTSSRMYGYLMSAACDGAGLSKIAKVKLLTIDDAIRVFNTSENVTVNGVKIGNAALFNPEAELAAEQRSAVYKIYRDGKAIEQLVVYELNSQGEVSSILAAEDRTYTGERDRNIFSLQYEAESSMFIGYALRMFGTKCRIKTDTPVFSVGESYDGTNDKQYKVVQGSVLEHSKQYPGLKIYDMNEENEAAVMVTKLDLGGGGGAAYTADAVLVKSVGTAVTEDSEVCESITVVSAGGREYTLFNPDEIKATFAATVIADTTDPAAVGGTLPETIPLSALRPGDVIKYSDVDSILNGAVVCYRVGAKKVLEKAYEGTSQKLADTGFDYYQALYVHSEVLYAGENGYRFYAINIDGVRNERTHTYDTTTVLIFDKDRQSITVGSSASLSKGDEFFASRRNTNEHLIVIYR